MSTIWSEPGPVPDAAAALLDEVGSDRLAALGGGA